VGELIRPEELPLWVPGDLTVDSAPHAWDGIRLRGYRYAASDVPTPAMHDYMIVVYEDGGTPMNRRRCDGAWRSEKVAPGSVSLLTHAAQSHWRWSDPIEVSHIYLSPAAVADVAAEVFERDIEDVELFDVLRAEDPVLAAVALSLRREIDEGGLGGRLYVDALKNQACIHLLRNYADVVFREPRSSGGLSRTQCRLVTQYVEENISRNISLTDLATVSQLSVFHFGRKFRNEFGCPPHSYVMRRRIEHAKGQLARKDELPLKVIAGNCGFSDQSHMTRLFRRLLNMTPAEYRKDKRGS
jgi:AraC family transcriptional regulator